jgi:site-specific DNA recombinase
MRRQSVAETLYEVDRRGWKSKSWVTHKGTTFGGNRFTRPRLEYLLSNPLYAGEVRLKGALHEGEHPAIVEPNLWQRVELLRLHLIWPKDTVS